VVTSPEFATKGSGTVTIVQEARQPVSATVPFSTIGSVEAELTPGQTWAVNGPDGDSVHLNGYAICDSTEPF
jgi:hypothetical protein